MIRSSVNPVGSRFAGLRTAPGRFAIMAALTAFSITASQAFAQKQVPPAPAAPTPQAAPAPAAPAGQAVPPAPAPAAAPVFPKPDPKNFTATSPTTETVDAFLHATWGYDPNRMWQVQAIQKTPVEGVSQVVVYVGDKTGKMKPAALVFFTMPDGKHIITGNQVIEFGAHPYADDRAQIQQRANGPYRGSASRNFELVEFADFECPHCKEAEANMEKLAQDFPQAHIVFQFYPLESIHPEAKKAAEYGYCVNKLGGSKAFFTFASAVFDGQQGLITPDGATLTLNSSVIKAGLDPKKVDACATLPTTSADIEASVKLAQDLNIFDTPTLMVNGRNVQPAGLPYDVLKQIVEYQARLDGVPLESASAAPAPAAPAPATAGK